MWRFPDMSGLICLASLHELVVGAFADNFTILQYDDLVSRFYCSNTLGDQENGAVACFLAEGSAERCVCFEVQGRKAVIKNEDFRLFYE
jgi:hypothetical protein